MKKILITGSSGYIGSHLSKMLVNLCYEVHGLDIKKPLYAPHNFSEIDITNKLTNFFPHYDCIIHLAALVQVGESNKIPSQYYHNNIQGTIQALNISHSNFIFASTGAAQQPNSPYAFSKLAAEQCVQELAPRKHTIFRFYNVVGQAGFKPTNPDGLMSKLIEAKKSGTFTLYGTDYATRDGTAVRDYVHVQEICAAIVEAVEQPSNLIENLGHGIGHTVREIAESFKQANNCDFQYVAGPRRPGDLESSVLDKPSKYMQRLYKIEELLAVRE